MDRLSIIYKELFTIKFVHPRFGIAGSALISDVLLLTPDQQTADLFRNNNVSYRFDNNTFTCFTRCELFAPPAADPKVSFTVIAADARIRFMVNAKADFFTKTDIQQTGTSQVYYFNNKANVATGMYITQTNTTVTNADLKDTILIEPQQKCLGVIDIFSSGAVNTTYELFKGANKTLRSPEFKVAFKNKI